MSPSRRRPEDKVRVIKTTAQLMREQKMQDAMAGLHEYFGKGTGVLLFTFDLGSNGYLSYKGNVPRADAVDVLKFWLEANK
jgi:hypothetical protein